MAVRPLRPAAAPSYSTPCGAPLGPNGECGSLFLDELVLRLPRNTRGRDFIVGDVRCAFDALAEAMRSVGFDPSRDRLICVGDLVDGGVRSSRVAEFLRQPHVFAVRGHRDHEFAQLDPVEMRMLARMPNSELAWTRTLPDDVLLAMQESLRALPLAIEISTTHGTVGIAHRQPTGGWQAFIDALDRRDERTVDDALAAPSAASAADDGAIERVEHLFVRHGGTHGAARAQCNVIAIDTGLALRRLDAALTPRVPPVLRLVHPAPAAPAFFTRWAPTVPWAHGMRPGLQVS